METAPGPGPDATSGRQGLSTPAGQEDRTDLRRLRPQLLLHHRDERRELIKALAALIPLDQSVSVVAVVVSQLGRGGGGHSSSRHAGPRVGDDRRL